MQQYTREDFKQLFFIDKEIAKLKEEREVIKTRGTHCTQIFSDMPHGSGTGRKIENAAVGLATVSEVLDYAIRKREREYVRLRERIDSVEDAEMRLILTLRYVDGLSWEEVGDAMDSTEEAARSKDKRFFKKLSNCS